MQEDTFVGQRKFKKFMSKPILLRLIIGLILITVVVLSIAIYAWNHLRYREPFFIVYYSYPNSTPVTVQYSKNMTLRNPGEIKGQTFDGWYYNDNGVMIKFNPETLDTSIYEEKYLYVYAKWVPNSQ